MSKTFRFVEVYMGYNENSITDVRDVVGVDLNSVISEEYEKLIKELKEWEDEELDLTFYEKCDGVGYSLGEESCMYVVVEEDEIFTQLSEDSNNWDDEKWEKWEKFLKSKYN